MNAQIEPHTLVLSTVWHHHLGVITNVPEGVNVVLNMNSFQEISFDVYKTWDGKQCELWDEIVSFKYVYIPEHEEYYEIAVSMDENDNTVKHITGKSAGATELGNRKLRNFHINDETDINYTGTYEVRDGEVVKRDKPGTVDFEYDTKPEDMLPGQESMYRGTVLYRPINDGDSDYLVMKKHRSSLLYRVLKDKCPDWNVGTVADTVANIQRTFTADNTTVYDFLTKTVGEELECMFEFDSVHRLINVYDLCNKCTSCNYRGDFVDKCPKCGGTDYIKGYGKNTGIYISTENYATEINISGATDNVKNCLQMVAGDDVMTAMIINTNPNGSQYIYHFSDSMLHDMPAELVQKIKDYNELYNSYRDSYAELTAEWSAAVANVLYLDSGMMPDTPIPGETTAAEQLGILENAFTGKHPEEIVVEENQFKVINTDSSIDEKHVISDNAVKSYARVLIDPRYTVDIVDGSSSVKKGNKKATWKGKFKVTALGTSDDSEDPDTATSINNINIGIIGNHDDYTKFCQQKVQKSLDRTDYAMTTILNIEDDDKFKAELKKYALQPLLGFQNAYNAILEVLQDSGVSEQDQMVYGVNVYQNQYKPYNKRLELVNKEITTRQEEVDNAISVRDGKRAEMKDIQKTLDFQSYIGDDLYIIFSHYLKEGEYNNSNYISTGLKDNEVVEKAKEFFGVASDEVIKASEIELSISESLINLLNMKEFKDFKEKLDLGDWIITSVDEDLYKLRLISVNYNDSSPESLSMSFTNVDRVKSLSDSLEDILNNAQSVASSYNAVAHQAKQGDEANSDITAMKESGVDSSEYQIYAGADNSITINEHGILLKSFDDVLGGNKAEQTKIMRNGMLFTQDDWESVETAIGKIRYTLNDELVETYGVNAKTMVAGTMIAGDIYSNNWKDDGSGNYQGSHFNLTDGDFIIGDGQIIYSKDDKKIILGDDVIVKDASGNPVPVSDITEIEVDVAGKQDKLTAGDNITINEDTDVISAVDTTYEPFDGASVSDDGTSGLVPQPIAGDQNKYLKGDGTWGTPPTSSQNHYGTTEPTSDIGNDGDLYMLYGDNGIVTVYGKINGTWLPFPSGGGGGMQISLRNITDIDTVNTDIDAYNITEVDAITSNISVT